ncbi:ABC transporter substrate-binding protein [Saccharopolyspora flava]|uniref:Peptide/nickel transport system substrate-binding protein n=1 Tax=Saccharopolyspora flava TaxID=95161 RepID=A0A1I6SQH6_9PSEU|nr:ABC transporter substrate-binding protein [Saccharopolyspora flava]SFS79255.1 peptide/nickel transport system substrate-binding protein [Saccharopolyspora flava]
MSRGRPLPRAKALAGAALTLMLAACGSSGAVDTRPSGPPQRGGELTVLADASFGGGWPTGLDPATNTTGGANISQMFAVYGGLFQLRARDDGSGAEVVPHQAESYELLDGDRTVRITLREGLRFSDGTPMDAEAVAFNLRRAMSSPCTCRPTWPLADNGITVENPRVVSLHFTRPYGAAVNSMPTSNANWIASPTALRKLGEEAFKITPVGAGPFVVESNKLSSELVLRRNPHYFEPGLPYLDKLTFKSIGGDQPAYQALLAGQAQAYEGLTTTPLLDTARQSGKLAVTAQPPTSPYVVQLNTAAAPFDDKRARDAIYAATDFQAISQGLFRGQYPVSQSFTGQGGLFHHEKVAGYPPHDPARARQLVTELGGLRVELGTLGNYVAEQVMTALQTQWRQAGIEVTVHKYELSTLVQQFNSGKWQAMLQTAGAWDPAAGVGVGFRFNSTSPFSGVSDPELDGLLNDAAATADPAQRDALYTRAAEHISDHAYAPFGLAFAPANLAVAGVHGPGLTTKIPPMLVNSGVLWDEVWREQR